MRNKEAKILRDMEAFIRYALLSERFKFTEVLFTLGHDVSGILNKDKCFLPRTHNYEQKLGEKLGGAK